MAYRFRLRGSEDFPEPKMGDAVVDLVDWTGLDEKHIPRAVRNPHGPWTYAGSICAELNDLSIDPRSGGIAGTAHLAVFLDVTVEHFRRNILPTLEFVHRWHGLSVTHTMSMAAFASAYRDEVWRARLERLGLEPTHVSSGPC